MLKINYRMKKIFLITTCIILSSISFQACKSKDDRISENVKNALSANYPTMHAAVKDGVVTIGGTAQTQQQKSQAEGVVKAIANVKSVVNNVTVVQSSIPCDISRDEYLKSTVESKLRSAGFNNVYVESTGGEIVLTGDIERKDLISVMQIANEANPQRVVNRLNIK
jgi:osmotically-inducible protein OsmY